MHGSYRFVYGYVFHALEMPLRATVPTDFGTRPAPQFVHLYMLVKRFFLMGQEICSVIRHHAERRHRAAPNGNDFFAEGGGNVHQPGIVAYDQL